MLRTAWSLFLAGLVLGAGPCLLSCGPLVVSYITARRDTPLEGLWTYGVFAVTRIAVYVAFGVAAGLIGAWVLERFFESFFLQVLFTVFGLFLMFLGVLIALSRFSLTGSCHRFLERSGARGGITSAIFFGLIVSFSPCLPLMAVLGYIMLISDSWVKGLVYMLFFGVGTVISPMIILALCAGWLGRVIKQSPWALRLVNGACGLIFIYLGIKAFLGSFFVS